MLIFLVDDHELIRDGLMHGLRSAGHNIVGSAESLSDARIQMAFVQAEIYIVDIQLPDGSGLELINSFGKFIMLTVGDDPATVNLAHQKGAAAYVLKGEPISHLLKVIEQVAEGSHRFESQPLGTRQFGLTARELDLLKILPRGLTTHEIASLFFVSESTVKTHLAAIFRKLKVINRTQAVIVGLKHGLIVE
jgi:DNA-binding NarL/FixJ family response regulator